MRLLITGALGALAAIMIAGGIAAGETSPSADTPPRSLEVELDEWDISMSPGELAKGTINLHQRNTGKVEHELLIVRTRLPADALPKGLEGVKPSLAGQIVLGREHSHGHHGENQRAHLQPGQSRRARIDLKPGRYVLLCTLPGHYEAGQRAQLVVAD